MLTSTYAYGGAELTVESISRGFDIALDGYVHVDFEGFSSIIDAMGGSISISRQPRRRRSRRICGMSNTFRRGTAI